MFHKEGHNIIIISFFLEIINTTSLMPASIHSSNILYVENDAPVKIGYKFLDNGSKVRYSKKTNNILD